MLRALYPNCDQERYAHILQAAQAAECGNRCQHGWRTDQANLDIIGGHPMNIGSRSHKPGNERRIDQSSKRFSNQRQQYRQHQAEQRTVRPD